MKTIISKHTDPYLNLATEEYLLKNTTDDILLFYINAPSLIIGKHQNSNLEINIPAQYQHNIPIIRRLSGGGTVFHDLGNINFCFITNEKNQHQIKFDWYAKPIQDALKTMGIEITIGKRHEFLIGDRKISGNASHVWKNRVIHHGTLLYDSNTNLLRELLKINLNKYQDKSIKSVSSHVTTIKEELETIQSSSEFMNLLASKVSLLLNTEIDVKFNPTIVPEINILINEKYKTWQWNFGYNPPYLFIQKISILNKSFEIQLNVEKGIIIHSEIYGEIEKEEINLLNQFLINKPHTLPILKEELKKEKATKEEIELFNAIIPLLF